MRAAWRAAAWLLLVLALYAVAVLFAVDVVSAEPHLGRWYPWLAAAAGLALLLLIAVIGKRLLRMQQRVRDGVPGARLARRLVWRFALLVFPPVLVVYGFALNFLVLTVDAWFNVRLEHALDDALSLGRQVVSDKLNQAERQTATLVAQLSGTPDASLQRALDEALDRMDALQLSVLSSQGQALALSSADPSLLTPPVPNAIVLTQLRSEGRYAAAEPIGDQLLLRVLLPLESGPLQSSLLQVLYALPPQTAALTQRIEAARFDFERLKFLRGALKLSFVLVLSFVVLLSVLATLLAAVAVARRLLAPIGQLAAATRAVAAGEYAEVDLSAGRDDDLGSLLDSFASMTRKLEQARGSAQASADETERQREYLHALLERLSSGVLGLDADATLRTVNRSASEILGVSLPPYVGRPLHDLRREQPLLAPLLDAILSHLQDARREWRAEVRLPRPGAEPLVLMLRGSVHGASSAGVVVVFDDLTDLNRAQRDAAWAEVAQRLAHEVKNPLTPIQLAAERMQHRLRGRLQENDAHMLERATGTIITQVDALKSLVNAFADYARTPHASLQPTLIDAQVADVLALYESDSRMRVITELACPAARVLADPGKLRQLLHNLIKNAQEAVGDDGKLVLEVSTQLGTDGDRVELRVADNGPGLPLGFDARWFEPYVSGKSRGGGLGLAVVKKIAEEHGGVIEARTRVQGGAEFTLQLPLAPARPA